jgi:hypothetical protein
MQSAQEAHPLDALTKFGRDMPLKEAVRPDLRNLQSESKSGQVATARAKRFACADQGR